MTVGSTRWGGLLVLIVPLAVAAVVVSRRWTAIVAAGAILTALLAAGLNTYPFAGRLMIFLVPVTLFIIAAGIDELDRIAGSVVAGIAAVLLLSIVIPTDVEVAKRPHYYSDMRGALEMVEQRFVDGDAIIVFNRRLHRYYAYKLTSPDVFVFQMKSRSSGRRAHASSIMEEIKTKGLSARVGGGRSQNRLAKGYIKEIARTAPIAFDWKAPGTRVVLFDFGAR